MSDLGTLQATLGVNTGPLGQARVAVSNWARQADQSMGVAQRASEKVDRAFTALGGTIAAVFGGRQIIRFAQQAVSSFGLLEQSIASASTLFGGVNVDLVNLQKQIIQLSSDTGMAAEEIGDSLYKALSAGIPVTEDMGQAMTFVRQASVLARSGFTDMTTAVEATAKTLNAYRMGVDQVERVHSILLQTQNRGITTVDELGGYLAQVTPIAAAMGVSLENVGAGLAVMTAQGLRTRVAITQMRSLFTELAQAGSSGAEALLRAQAAAGMTQRSFSELMADGMSLGDVLNIIRDYADSTGKSVLELFGSVEAGQAVLSLTGANAAKMAEVFGEMSEESTILQDSYSKVMDTLRTRTSQFANDTRLLGTAVGQVLAPALTDVIGYFGDWVIKARHVIEQNLDTYAYRLATFVKLVANNMDKVFILVKGLVGVKLYTWFMTATTGAYGLAGGLAVAAAAAKTLGRALAVGLAVEGIGLAMDAFNELKGVVESSAVTWGDIGKMAIEGYINGILNGLELLGRYLPKLVGDLITRPLAASISSIFSKDTLTSLITGRGMDVAYNAAEAHSDEVSRLLDEFAEAYRTLDQRRIVKLVSDESINQFVAGKTAYRASQTATPWLDSDLTITPPELPALPELDLDALLGDWTNMLGTAQSATQRYLDSLKSEWQKYTDDITLMDYEGWDARNKEIDIWATNMEAQIRDAEAWSTEVGDWIQKVADARRDLVAKEQGTSAQAARTAAVDRITALREETEALRQGRTAWEKYKQNIADAAEVDLWTQTLKDAGASAEYIQTFIESFTEWRATNRAAQESMVKWSTIAANIAETVSGVFRQMGDHIISNLMRGKAAFEDFGEFARMVIEQVLQQMLVIGLINPLQTGLTKWLGGILPSAQGNVFGPQGVVPFAKGGVVTRPTVFPFANGGVGLMGEAGYEGILPLTRINGKLGVHAAGAGGGVTVNINNQGEPLQVAGRSQRTGPDGDLIIDIAVRNSLNRLDGGGQLDGLFQGHGAQRRGIR